MRVMTRYESGRKFSGVRRDHRHRRHGCHRRFHHRHRGSRHHRLRLLREEPSSRRLHRREARNNHRRYIRRHEVLSNSLEDLALNNRRAARSNYRRCIRHGARNMILRPDNRRADWNTRHLGRSSCVLAQSSYRRRAVRCFCNLSRREASRQAASYSTEAESRNCRLGIPAMEYFETARYLYWAERNCGRSALA